MKSHLISQVVLRRFSNNQGLVKVNYKDSRTSDLLLPENMAYTEIDREIIGESEQKWSSDVENHSNKALNSLVAGNLLYSEKHMKLIKKLLALHFVRSTALLEVMAKGQKYYANKIAEDVSLAYPEHKQLIESFIAQEWGKSVTGSIPEVIEENLSKVELFMDKHGLEIGLAPEGSYFVIGDIPAITISEDRKLGVLSGVPVTEAVSFAMPLTPKHLVALKTGATSKKYALLTQEQVDNVNGKQVRHCLELYYSLPQS